MSNEIQNLEFNADRHPDENHLLLALEGELSAGENAEVERHVASCWDCRARYHEMHRGILAFVEYREKLYLPELEPAPGDFRQFRPLLNQAAAKSPDVGLLDRIRGCVRSFLSFAQLSLQIRWVTATAAVMVAVLVWTQVLNPTTLSASELLTKAVQSQNPPAAVHRMVRQKVRVKTARAQMVREFQWETGGPIPGVMWGTDPENWNAPMTAQGFSEWHDSLSVPKDKVVKSGDHWTLKTIAPTGPIKEASIVIHTGDFHPTEEHIRFSDNRTLDLQEVAFEITDLTAPLAPAVQSTGSGATTQSLDASAAASVHPAVNLDEAELGLRYAMFLQHLDEDEDLQISRAADAVIVNGIASSANRSRQLQTLLAGLPGVRLSIAAPGLPADGLAPRASQQTPNSSSVPLLKDRLDSAFPSVETRRDFVDSCLSVSDSALSNAWALKKLADRYTDETRRALKPESQAKLYQMMRGHLDQIAAANVKLNTLLDLLPPSRPSQTEIPQGLRAGIAALFDLVQRQDSLVAALVAGTQTTDTTATAADRFRAGHETIARLAGELEPGDGRPPK